METKRKIQGFFLWNGGIALAGLIFRLIAGFELYRFDRTVSAPALVTDMATYLNFAREILSGEIPREFYYQPFYYSVFLPFVQFFTGTSIPAVIIAQSLCGAAAVYLCGILAARIAGKKAGLLAAGFLALSRIAIIYTPYALLETMQSFWLILLLFMTFYAWTKNRLWQWLLTGVILSFAILSRGNAWCFLPGIFLAVWFASRKKEKRKRFACLAAGAVLLGTILPQIPFSLVNTVEHGTFRGPSTAGGNVLALGNTPEAPPGGLTYPETYQLWMDHEETTSIPARILNWAFLELQFRKVFLFWNHTEIPNNISPERSAKLAPILKSLKFLSTGIILTAALLCIFLSLRKIFTGKEHLLITILFVLLYNLAMAAFYNLARFRVPCVPLLCVLGGCGVIFFLQHFRKGVNCRQQIMLALLALFFAWFLAYPGSMYYRNNIEPGIMRLVRPHGIDVPNRTGGRLIYDNGPRLQGGWQPAVAESLFKTFSPKNPIPAGEKVKLTIPVVCRNTGERPIIRINDLVLDLSHLRKEVLDTVQVEIPYPEDRFFRIALSENVCIFLDLQRAYGRTFDKNGLSLNSELVISISTVGENPEK